MYNKEETQKYQNYFLLSRSFTPRILSILEIKFGFGMIFPDS